MTIFLEKQCNHT